MLLVLGLCFGSFVNALVWRLHAKKDWVKARSQCVHCGHVLKSLDLIPILSWLLLRGRCRYCQKPISAQYPVVESVAALIFVGSYSLWPVSLTDGQWVLLATWLASSIGLLALAVYDLRWWLLPNKILYPTAIVAAIGRLIYIVGFEPDKLSAGLNWLLGVIIASGIFGLIFIASKGKWIGFGDVRLGLITGTLLATPAKSFLMIFLASILGMVFVLPALMTGRKKLAEKVPFGPFLIAATGILVLYGQKIIDWYNQLLI